MRHLLIRSVSCSVRYSWFLVPRSSDLTRNQSMVPGCLPALTGWMAYLASDIRRCAEYIACRARWASCWAIGIGSPTLLAWGIGIRGNSSRSSF